MAESSMSTDQKISLMQDLFGLCDNVFTWCYDANGTMLTTNCPDQTVLDTAFSAFGIKNRLLAAAEGGRPVLLGTAIGLVYGADFEHDAQGSLRRCWLLGPVFYSTVSMGQLELGYGNYQGLELSLAWKEQFMQAAARLPVVSNVLLGRYLLMLHFGLTGERLNISDLLLPSEDLHPLPERSAPERDRYQVYAAERALLGMVRNGDMNYQEALSHSISVSSGVRVSGPDPLRQAKTSCIVFTSLVCRAAIEGGLSPEEAYSLGTPTSKAWRMPVHRNPCCICRPRCMRILSAACIAAGPIRATAPPSKNVWITLNRTCPIRSRRPTWRVRWGTMNII